MGAEQPPYGITVEVAHECPYFPGREGASSEVYIPGQANMHKFGEYLDRGFRRYGKFWACFTCTPCRECQPIRLRPALYRPSRSQRRWLRKNADLEISITRNPIPTYDRFLLFDRYVRTRHNSMKHTDEGQAGTFLSIYNDYPDTIEMAYYLDQRHIASGVLDITEHSVSSVYFYYAPEFMQRRLGTFSMAMEIELARKLGREFFHPGIYIHTLSCMSYKRHFRPNELYVAGQWLAFERAS